MLELGTKVNNVLLGLGFKGTKEEKRIYSLGNLILKNVKKIKFGSKKEDWENFSNYKKELLEMTENYSGKFNDYFRDIVKDIEFEESLSYRGVHSD